MNNKFLKMAFAGLVLGVSGFANAGLIYDNGGPDTSNGFSIAGSNEVVDDFILTNAFDINSVGFYFQNFDGITGWNQDITYSVYNDNSGSKGSLISTGAGQNVIAVDSGLAWCCNNGHAWLVTFDLDSSLSLNAGHYWLGLSGATGTGPEFWLTTSGITGYKGPGGGDLAYSLHGDVGSTDVPEPSTLAIFALGLMGLASRRFKKQS
jgi:hypothetical protein